MPDQPPPRPGAQLVERRYPTGVLYGIRIMFPGRRLYLTLGHERDGWNRDLAERTLSVVVAACRVQARVSCARRRRLRPR